MWYDGEVKITIKGKTYTSLGKGKWKGPKGEKLDWIEISSKASALGNKTVQYEGNPTPEIQKKLIKIFQNDPLYKDVIIATNAKEARKALDILKSIRGPNAITLLKKHSKKLMGSDY